MVERNCSQSVSSASLHVIQRDVDEPRRHGAGPDSDRLLLRDLPVHVVPPRVVGSASRRATRVGPVDPRHEASAGRSSTA